MYNNYEDRKNVHDDDWRSFEMYLERMGVVTAITNALCGLFDEKPSPRNINQYLFCKLGGDTASQMKHRLAKLKNKIEKVSREIAKVNDEIENLLLIRDNGLDFNVYRDFVDRKRAEK